MLILVRNYKELLLISGTVHVIDVVKIVACCEVLA